MQSPWLYQLQRLRPVSRLQSNLKTNIAVVGGGIAGVMTSYFLLRDTKKSVALIEADKIAHGATGHNAGQVTSYFERPFSELVEEFGLKLATEGQSAVESAWLLLEEVIQETKLQTPLWQVTGYAGLTSIDLVLEHLKNNALKIEGGVIPESLMLAEEVDRSRIPVEYESLYTVVPQSDVLSLLETQDTRYVAALTARKGCLNSALFCEELIGYMLEKFAGRFMLSEHTPVKVVRLFNDHAVLETQDHTVTAERVVLCTNGFEHFDLVNEAGAEVNTKFHHMIHGTVGYMSGYLDPIDQPPSVVSYLDDTVAGVGDTEEPSVYYYLTRRPFENEKKEIHNLISVGGPDSRLPDMSDYSKSLVRPKDVDDTIQTFLHKTYKHTPKDLQMKFVWHGLMGYTPNSVRRVGPEPLNPVLMYNLGCNGVGILASIYGGHRISRHVKGDKLEPSMFDIPKAE